MKQIWDKRDDESTQAYEAFQVYLELGANRTCSGVAKELRKSYTLIHKWLKQFDWKTRAVAYDSSVFEEARVEKINQKKIFIERKIEIAQRLERKALMALEQLNLNRISARGVVEMLTLANQLRGEALELKAATEDDEVTQIIITAE